MKWKNASVKSLKYTDEDALFDAIFLEASTAIREGKRQEIIA
jgi:hypothetical protein